MCTQVHACTHMQLYTYHVQGYRHTCTYVQESMYTYTHGSTHKHTYIYAHASVCTRTHVVTAVLSHIPVVLVLNALLLAAGDFHSFCVFIYIFELYVHMITYSTILQIYMGKSWLLSSLAMMLASEAILCLVGVMCSVSLSESIPEQGFGSSWSLRSLFPSYGH